jgi:hypothetical protein
MKLLAAPYKFGRSGHCCSVLATHAFCIVALMCLPAFWGCFCKAGHCLRLGTFSCRKGNGIPVASFGGEGSAGNLGEEGMVGNLEGGGSAGIFGGGGRAGNLGGVGSPGKLREGGVGDSGEEGSAGNATVYADDIIADLASEELSSISLNEYWEAAEDLVGRREENDLELPQNVTETDAGVSPYVGASAIDKISDTGEERDAEMNGSTQNIKEPSAMSSVHSSFEEARGGAEETLLVDEDGTPGVQPGGIIKGPGSGVKPTVESNIGEEEETGGGAEEILSVDENGTIGLQPGGFLESPGSVKPFLESRVGTEEEGREGWSEERTGLLEEGPEGQNTAGAATSDAPGNISGEGETAR